MEEDSIVPDAIFFNTLLNGYCEAGKLNEAEGLILEMKERDIPLTASTYNTLIKGYGLARQPEEAMKLLQEMGKSDTSKPNDRTFNMLIKVWAQDKNPEKARHVISLMRAAGVGPDVVSYNTLAQVSSVPSLELFRDGYYHLHSYTILCSKPLLL
jgi:pentatricopeptide repeat domain-containing protein 1